MFPDLIKHIIHNKPSLPPQSAIAYEYVLASNGVFLRAENQYVEALIPVLQGKNEIRGLYTLSPYIELKALPVPAHLLTAILVDARKAQQNGQLIERLYHFRYDPSGIRVERPAQNATKTRIHSDTSADNDIILELHSHGSLRAFFSDTDNADEQEFRFYGVIGNLNTNNPSLQLRLGIYGYFYPISQLVLFDGISPFYEP